MSDLHTALRELVEQWREEVERIRDRRGQHAAPREPWQVMNNCTSTLSDLLARFPQGESSQVEAENATLREALVKVRAHTIYRPDATRDLLVGLLASIERVADAILTPTARAQEEPSLPAPPSPDTEDH